MEYVKVLIGAVLGIAGYALAVKQSLRALPMTLVAGLCGTIVYFVSQDMGASLFVSSFFAALVIELICEINARIIHIPVHVFLMPAVITLVPGGLLYYTMSYLLARNYEAGLSYAEQTLQVAAGLADGIISGYVIVATVKLIIGKILEGISWIKTKNKSKKTSKKTSKKK